MKKKLFLFLTLHLIFLFSFAQREGDAWYYGTLFDVNLSFTDSMNYLIVDENNLLNEYNTYTDIRRTHSNTSICDSTGQVIIYSYGRAIYDANHQVINNGDSIFGAINFPEFYYDALAQQVQDVLMLPDFKNIKQSNVFHLRTDDPFPPLSYSEVYVTAILETKVVNTDSAYVAIEKAKELVNMEMERDGIAACRHANGRDWWLMAVKKDSDCYISCLYTPDTILIEEHCLGIWEPDPIDVEIGISFFSQDGSKYVVGNYPDGIRVFDFDRCTGMLSNKIEISYYEIVDSLSLPYFRGSCALSNNNRFLYTSTYDKLYQFDLQDTNILASKTLLVFNDSLQASFDYIFDFNMINKNGKIYICSGNFRNIHIIHNPDEKGLACNVEVKHPLLAPGGYALPNHPNFRLGALTGSACDTLGVGISYITEGQFSLFPNPAKSLVRVDYGSYYWQGNENLELTITDVLGKEVFTRKIERFSAYQDINVSSFTKGVYLVLLLSDKGLIHQEKLLVE